jgi:geranylgeranyl pyrophosphate synthase
VGRPGLTDAEVASIQQVIVDTGALADLEATIAGLTAGAVAALDRLELVGDARDELIALAEFVSQRET